MRTVRLSDHDLKAIIALFKQHFLANDHLWLFGSRVDMSKKGGDIDLYIETSADDVERIMKMKNDFLWDLEHKIGEQKIDAVINRTSSLFHLPIYTVAKTEGVQLV